MNLQKDKLLCINAITDLIVCVSSIGCIEIECRYTHNFITGSRRFIEHVKFMNLVTFSTLKLLI